MSIDTELADWGEPPATPAEEKLSSLLDKALAHLDRGRTVKSAGVRSRRPELRARGERLLQTVQLLHECAASVWEHTAAPGPAAQARQYSTIDHDAAMPAESAIPVVPLPDPFPGEFRVVRLLGEGAFGKVWLAEDLKLGRSVALKTVKLKVPWKDPTTVLAALRNEAQQLARLDHPNIVRVHAWREAGGEHYLVLQYVEGGSLGDRLDKGGALPWQDAARYVTDVGEALIAAHNQAVIHRDIKPDNILWDRARDEAILTDFGIAARLAEPGTPAGTPMYMAPEAFAGSVTPALDVYSLSATLFRLVTGKLPFARAALSTLVEQKMQSLPSPDPRCVRVPEAIEQLMRAGMAADPAQRPALADFIAGLRGALNQLMADALPLAASGAGAPARLELIVSRQAATGSYERVAASTPPLLRTRDIKKVPAPPAQVGLRTGDRVRLEVVADRPGYVTVFNIGPTGNLNLLYPEPAQTAPAAPIAAGVPLHVLDVEMTPPAGRERLFAVWSRTPMPLRPEQLASLVHAGPRAESRPYLATRDLERVQQSVQKLAKGDWHAAVLEVDHSAAK